MALTEWYVSDAGAGSGAGTSAANAMSFAAFITAMGATANAGDRYNIVGPITSRTTTTDTFSRSGSATSPIIIRGCSNLNTIADGYLGRTNGNGPLITTNMPTITYTSGRMNCTGTFLLFESIQITGAFSGNQLGLAANSAIRGCKITNSSTNGSAGGIGAAADNVILDCDITLSGASGGAAAVALGTTTSRLIGCRINGGPAAGVTTGNALNVIAKNTIFSSTGNHITMNSTSGSPCILDNTLVGGGADGINIITGATKLQCIIGNISTDNTGDGLDMVSTANSAVVAYLRTRDNANGIANGGDWITATSYGNVTTDTGGPETDYTNSGSNDYSLISTSPAVSVGIPLYASIGALQRVQNAASGGIVVPTITIGAEGVAVLN